MTQNARSERGAYTILLILTDGAITDMQNTIDAIVGADDAPLSIIIVGVGHATSADWASMDQLDGDDEPLRASNGRVTRRDLVQFVPFQKFDGANTPVGALASEVLQEVPEQVVEWALLNHITPDQFTPGPTAERANPATVHVV